MEHDGGGGALLRHRSARGRGRRQGPRLPARGPAGRQPRGAAHPFGHQRTRSRHRRRLRAGLRHSHRRRAGHRQVDAAHPGVREARHAQAPRRLHLGRGSGGAGAPARHAPRARPGARGACGRDERRRHRRNPAPGRDAGPRRHRFHPDHVDRRGGRFARHRDAGAHVGAGAHPLRQDLRRLRDHGRPRHQGRADRRPARRRAHGRRRRVLRGRGRARSSASCAR